jgi:hypothetical protein
LIKIFSKENSNKTNTASKTRLRLKYLSWPRPRSHWSATGPKNQQPPTPNLFVWLVVWLVAGGWCRFVMREKCCWLVVDGWFVLREKYCWLVADKPTEHADRLENATELATRAPQTSTGQTGPCWSSPTDPDNFHRRLLHRSGRCSTQVRPV